MLLKPAVWFAVLLAIAEGFPQAGLGEATVACAQLAPEGYRCVAKEKCFVTTCGTSLSTLSQQIFGSSAIRTFNADVCSGFSGSFRKRAECEEEPSGEAIRSSVDDDSQHVCCHQSDILPAVIVDLSNKRCSEIEGFECMPFQECTDTETFSNLHIFNETLMSGMKGMLEAAKSDTKCNSTVEVCCKSKRPIEQPTTTAETLLEVEQQLVTKFTSKCGTRNVNGVGAHESNAGHSTKFGEWPHMCLIQRLRPSSRGKVSLAGGSLIAPGIVITAAHWVYDLNINEILVTCGDWDTEHETEPRPSQERLVRRISSHPGFKATSVFNDVALLHVKEDFYLDEHVNVVCLPTATDFDDFDKENCVATGWGKDSAGDHGELQNLLQQITLPFVDHDSCQEKLRDTKLGPHFVLDDSFNCAGGKANEDTCKGDGGSPLVCPLNQDPEHYVQVGIVAVGLECGLPNVPGIYASVPHALCFIKMATFCNEGNRFRDFYAIEGCERWFDQEVEHWTYIKDGFEIIVNNDRNSPEIQARFQDKLEHAAKTLENIDRMAKSCGT